MTWNTQGFLWTWKTHWILGEFCATSGKNCNKQSIFSLSFKYLCKTADWVNRIIRNRDEVRMRWWPVILLELMWNDPWWRSLLHLLFCCDNLWKSKFVTLEKSGKLRDFFSYFVATKNVDLDVILHGVSGAFGCVIKLHEKYQTV